MEEELQNDPLDYTDPVIVKVPLKTPDDALNYWNHRMETVSIKILQMYKLIGISNVALILKSY